MSLVIDVVCYFLFTCLLYIVRMRCSFSSFAFVVVDVVVRFCGLSFDVVCRLLFVACASFRLLCVVCLGLSMVVAVVCRYVVCFLLFVVRFVPRYCLLLSFCC